jgi:hypothetical protein
MSDAKRIDPANPYPIVLTLQRVDDDVSRELTWKDIWPLREHFSAVDLPNTLSMGMPVIRIEPCRLHFPGPHGCVVEASQAKIEVFVLDGPHLEDRLVVLNERLIPLGFVVSRHGRKK